MCTRLSNKEHVNKIYLVKSSRYYMAQGSLQTCARFPTEFLWLAQIGRQGAEALEKNEDALIQGILHRLFGEEEGMPRVLLTKGDGLEAAVIDAPGAPVLVVSTALMRGGLSNDELEGVLAHEISHIRNHDKLRTRLLFIFVTWLAADSLGLLSLPPAIPSRGYVTPVAMMAYLCGRMPLDAFARSREYAADKTATGMSGNSAALIRALQKLDTSYSKNRLETRPQKNWQCPSPSENSSTPTL